MALTTIEWTFYRAADGVMVPGYTFNAWLGCDKKSPACKNCYITRTPALRVRGLRHGAPRERTATSTWEQPRAWNRKAEREGTRPRVFCNSLADWLDDKVPIEWLADLLKLIHQTPNLDWLLLTKRPENFSSRMEEVAFHLSASSSPEHDPKFYNWLTAWHVQEGCEEGQPDRPPENVWIGATVEDQVRADERIPLLLSIPARIHFLSCEPLLGPVKLKLETPCTGPGSTTPCAPPSWNHLNALTGFKGVLDYKGRGAGYVGPKIGWVICGGESGNDPRPSHPYWFRSLRDQCSAAGVPFFFKQHGEHLALCDASADLVRSHVAETVYPQPGSSAEGYPVYRVGKKVAGRLLDGLTHNEYPTFANA